MSDFEPQQEKDVLPARNVVMAALVFLGIAGAAVVVEAAILNVQTRARNPGYEVAAPSGTVEQTLIENTKRGPDLQMDQRKKLAETGWVDKAHGIARIPIERAMDLVVAQEGKSR